MNYKDVIDSCFELLNDVIDIGRLIFPSEEKSDEFRQSITNRYLMYPMFINVIYPNLQFTITGLLLGALPQVIYSLRTALEAFALALYVDNDPELRGIDWSQKMERKDVKRFRFGKPYRKRLAVIFRKVMDEQQAERSVDSIFAIFRELSAWIHPIATVRRITERGEQELTAGLFTAILLTIAGRGAPPSYGVLIPSEYNEADLEDLRHLENLIERVRSAITLILYAWLGDKDFLKKEEVEKFFSVRTRPDLDISKET